jgi:hypothetical protein
LSINRLATIATSTTSATSNNIINSMFTSDDNLTYAVMP